MVRLVEPTTGALLNHRHPADDNDAQNFSTTKETSDRSTYLSNRCHDYVGSDLAFVQNKRAPRSAIRRSFDSFRKVWPWTLIRVLNELENIVAEPSTVGEKTVYRILLVSEDLGYCIELCKNHQVEMAGADIKQF